jgi:hypothetical protein
VRRQRETRHCRDRRQRLAAEAERAHALEIVERLDLARGVARERENELVDGNAVAVVAHAACAHATLLGVDLDAGCARVERVLEQLLQHGGWALDDLARGDLVDERRRKHANRHAPQDSTLADGGGRGASPCDGSVALNGIASTCPAWIASLSSEFAVRSSAMLTWKRSAMVERVSPASTLYRSGCSARRFARRDPAGGFSRK